MTSIPPSGAVPGSRTFADLMEAALLMYMENKAEIDTTISSTLRNALEELIPLLAQIISENIAGPQ